MVHLRAKKIPGRRRKTLTYYYLVRDDYSSGKKVKKVVKYLGNANKILEKILRLEKLEKKIR